jgi:N-acetylmuramoyl-L-alanine amidase CwlA
MGKKKNNMQITQKYIPINTLRRSGQKLQVKFLVAHDVGNDGSTALQNVDYYIKSANEDFASAHTFIDDQNIIECIPQDEKANHVRRNPTVDNTLFGVEANDCALGVELCYFSKDLQRSKMAYTRYCEYIKALCQKYQLNPSTHVVGHYRLDPERRVDPLNAFRLIGKNWEDFIKDISSVPKEDIKNQIRRLLELL